MKILYILLAIVILLILIMVHELGHYLAGKLLKFKINEFSIGFGKAIYQKTLKSGEKFSLRIFPLGGYCSFDGEDEDKDAEGSFNKQAPWKRLIVLFSGVFFNFLFGVITSVIYLCMASYVQPQVLSIYDGNTNPFQVGDVIVAVDGKKLDYYKISSDTLVQFSNKISKYDENEEFVVTVLRDGKKENITVSKQAREPYRYVLNAKGILDNGYYKDDDDNYVKFTTEEEAYNYLLNTSNELTSVYRYNEETGEYLPYAEDVIKELCQITISDAGVSLGILQTYHYTRYNFGQALIYAVPFCLDVCWLLLACLGGLFTGATKVSDLGGTVTAVSQIAELTAIDFRYIFYLIPLISMNLALFNILPIPALDGARMVFVLIEWIFKKPVNRNVEGYIHFFGLIALLALVVFLDIYHFFIL
ncbi:MAG: RIP metalloprotease RseP [Christensenellales bacterium]